MLCPPLLKKRQKIFECRPKNWSASWHCFEKLECRPALHFRLFKTFFFWLFSTYLFWPYIVEHAWAEKLIFLPFQKYFWHAWMRYNPMYACTFKLTRTRNVKTSIGDNFLVCGSIWVCDASFWSYWPKDSLKIILGSIRCLEKNWAETLEMHGFLCRNAQSPNRVQVVSLWSCWPNDSYECIFISIGCLEQTGTKNPKCAQISVSGSVFWIFSP